MRLFYLGLLVSCSVFFKPCYALVPKLFANFLTKILIAVILYCLYECFVILFRYFVDFYACSFNLFVSAFLCLRT